MNERNDLAARRDALKLPLLLALLLGLACAFVLPPYSGPDENGHVAYVAALAQGHLPIIPQGEIADIARGISWQGQHPPLFYVLGTPLYFLSGQNPTLGLYLLRALNVLLLLVVVWLVHRVAGRLLSAHGARAAAFVVALHPTLVYTSSMVNNEILAVVFSLLCIDNALRWRDDEASAALRKRALGLMILCAGLALWTKLTAIAGVLAAATIVLGAAKTGDAKVKRQWSAALLVLVGALVLWLPWALLMKSAHGVWVPSPINRPVLGAGLWSLTLESTGWIVAFLTSSEMSIGLLAPYWLIAPYSITYYPMVVVGLVLSLWSMSVARRQPRFAFCATAWWALFVLLVAQGWLRDARVGLFAARYVPILIVLFALPTAQIWESQPPARRRLLATVASAWSLAVFVYLFAFFLIGNHAGTLWNNQ